MRDFGDLLYDPCQDFVEMMIHMKQDELREMQFDLNNDCLGHPDTVRMLENCYRSSHT
jgi:hypothetical protein